LAGRRAGWRMRAKADKPKRLRADCRLQEFAEHRRTFVFEDAGPPTYVLCTRGTSEPLLKRCRDRERRVSLNEQAQRPHRHCALLAEAASLLEAHDGPPRKAARHSQKGWCSDTRYSNATMRTVTDRASGLAVLRTLTHRKGRDVHAVKDALCYSERRLVILSPWPSWT
jgi:hypothetical protein